MAIDLRKDEECRKSLMKHFRDNEMLYGKVDVHITIAVSDFLLEWETKKETKNNVNFWDKPTKAPEKIIEELT